MAIFGLFKICVIEALLFLSNYVIGEKECANFAPICSQQNNCRDCLRAHYCCEWCYDEDIKQRQCITKNSSFLCKADSIERNYGTGSTKIQDLEFTDVKNNVNNAIQFKPQEYNIKLRQGEAINISISYRPARDYPLDLYYLMDLTRSMTPDLQTLTVLGEALAALLQNLTRHHRIAFGSYIDKPEMPFYPTDPLNVENPCRIEAETCEKGYMFKHRLNFTEDIETFVRQVKSSGISANIDDPEGGIDAVMQIALCKKQLGWFTKSRKIILVATGGTLHFAGDGLLAGYTKQDVTNCHIDFNGNYLSTENNDYPSLEEVYHQLKAKKINLIVAAKSNVNKYYKEMADLITETMFVGELEKESKNVLSLVKEGYEAFLKKVNLFISEKSRIPGVEVEFFVDCNNDGHWVKKSSCTDAKEGKVMHFIVEFSLKQYQTENSVVVYIEENNIQEKVKVSLEFVGNNCECKFLNKSKEENICIHGKLSCEECVCDDGWSGPACSKKCTNNYNKCRYRDDDGILSITCSGRGECICDHCKCYSMQFNGDFCEFECPIDKRTNKICSGHGNCINGTCYCEEKYSGIACACHQSNETCTIPGTRKICNEKGSCKCDKCECNHGFSGSYCEKCENCNELCDHYTQYLLNNNKTHENVTLKTVDQLPTDKQRCLYKWDSTDGKQCVIYYDYQIIEKNKVKITATKDNCYAPKTASFYIWTILGAFLSLIALIIMCWKGRNMYLDRKEYQEFKRNQSLAKHSEMNPIYKNPISTYHPPTN